MKLADICVSLWKSHGTTNIYDVLFKGKNAGVAIYDPVNGMFDVEDFKGFNISIHGEHILKLVNNDIIQDALCHV